MRVYIIWKKMALGMLINDLLTFNEATPGCGHCCLLLTPFMFCFVVVYMFVFVLVLWFSSYLVLIVGLCLVYFYFYWKEEIYIKRKKALLKVFIKKKYHVSVNKQKKCIFFLLFCIWPRIIHVSHFCVYLFYIELELNIIKGDNSEFSEYTVCQHVATPLSPSKALNRHCSQLIEAVSSFKTWWRKKVQITDKAEHSQQ